MAQPFHLPVTAAHIGTYFVGQYYQVLQQQPEFVHQFYNDGSTMVRIDGNIRETASAMLQIHTLIMSLNYTGVVITTAHSLESWSGGVLIMVSGSLHVKDFNGRRKFVQTFFLAPQETGYFVLNDIFHFIEEDQIHHLPVAYVPPGIHESKLNGSTAIQDQVSSYMLGGDFQAREFVVPANVEENVPVDNYSFPEQQLHQVPEAENIPEDNFVVQSNGSLQTTVNPLQDNPSTPVNEPVGEPQKHTYASIVAKGQSAPVVSAQLSIRKTTPPTSEWNHVLEPSSQPSFAPSVPVDSFGAEPVEEIPAVEDEVEIKSVYVRNVPSTATALEIEEEFKKFGQLKRDAVAIRSRKDMDVCYAFVEFEDIAGVQNAIKASTVEIAGQQVYIEGRRANRNNMFRGGRGRGRGRGSYHMDLSRGRYGSRNFSGRGSSHDGDNSSKPRGNGYYWPRQERELSGNKQMSSRNGRSPSE